ncbi:MAG: hypothetical protein IIB63_01335, partial [Proteobacteria bacterium]|nr:hypothetical protein [Pseudomonadota bacterium]
TGLEGDFGDILTGRYMTEATYLDWATRLIQDGKRPANDLYREWIEIHGPEVRGDLVSWMGRRLDGEGRTARREHLFLTAGTPEYLGNRVLDVTYLAGRWFVLLEIHDFYRPLVIIKGADVTVILGGQKRIAGH